MPEDYVPAAEGLAAQVVEVKKKVRIPVEAQKELHVCRERLVPGFHPYAQPESLRWLRPAGPAAAGAVEMTLLPFILVQSGD